MSCVCVVVVSSYLAFCVACRSLGRSLWGVSCSFISCVSPCVVQSVCRSFLVARCIFSLCRGRVRSVVRSVCSSFVIPCVCMY